MGTNYYFHPKPATPCPTCGTCNLEAQRSLGRNFWSRS